MCQQIIKTYSACECITRSHAACAKFHSASKIKIGGEVREPELKDCPDWKEFGWKDRKELKGTCGMLPGGRCPYVEEKLRLGA
jgi:hypothetical protein